MFYVCSKGRPDFVRAHLGNWTSHDLPVWLVIEPDDEPAYRAAVEAAYEAEEVAMDAEVDVAIIDKPNSGISYARNVAVHHAAEQGYESMVMCDDDLLVDDAQTLIQFVEDHPDQAGVGAYSRIYKHFLGIPPDSGPHVHRKGMGQQLVAYRTEPVLEVGGFDTRIRVLEDVDLVMMLVAAGYGPWHIHSDVHERHVGKKGQAGGIALSGNRERLNRAAVDVLMEKWPGIVSHATRKGEHTYRIQWKKFYLEYGTVLSPYDTDEDRATFGAEDEEWDF